MPKILSKTNAWFLGVLFLKTIYPVPVQAAGDLLIFGGEDNRQFLGCLTCNDTASDSVWNPISSFSWDSSAVGVWSSAGRYSGSIGNFSACNQFATRAPVIVDRAGNFYWRLTVNQFTSRSVCAYGGNTTICEALTRMCEAQ